MLADLIRNPFVAAWLELSPISFLHQHGRRITRQSTHIDHAALQDIFDEEELTTLNYYHLASAMNYEMALTKWERGAFPEQSMKAYDAVFKSTANYLLALNSGMIPRRLRERYLTSNG